MFLILVELCAPKQEVVISCMMFLLLHLFFSPEVAPSCFCYSIYFSTFCISANLILSVDHVDILSYNVQLNIYCSSYICLSGLAIIFLVQ